MKGTITGFSAILPWLQRLIADHIYKLYCCGFFMVQTQHASNIPCHWRNRGIPHRRDDESKKSVEKAIFSHKHETFVREYERINNMHYELCMHVNGVLPSPRVYTTGFRDVQLAHIPSCCFAFVAFFVSNTCMQESSSYKWPGAFFANITSHPLLYAFD